MVRSLLYLQPLAGDYDELQRYFEDQQVLETAATIPGFLTGELHAPVEPGRPALVTALWESPEAYQRWLDSPLRSGDEERAKRTFEVLSPGAGAVYRLAHRVVGRSAPEGSERG